MAREMYLAGVDEEELRPDPKPEGPKTAKGKWENFWYHYKWTTIIVAFVVIVASVMFYQILSKDDPDYVIVLGTQNSVSDEQTHRLADELEKYGRDIDGDGKVEVQIEPISLSGNTQYSMVGKQKLLAHFSAGDVMFYIFDKQSYDENVAALQEADSYQFFSAIDVQANGLENNGTYWNWKSDPVRSDPDLSSLPENLYFGVRNVSGTAENKKSQKLHDDCMDLLKAYITKTPLTDSAE